MNTRRAPRLLFALLVLGMVALILRLRLAPFDFVWDGRIPWERATLAPLTIRDVPLNILLFAPLGFALAGLLGGRGRAARRPWVVAGGTVVLGVLFSAALEGAQFFLPERVPSLADVIANGLGALLGAALFNGWAMGVGRALERVLTWRNVLVGLALYALGAALLTAHLGRSVFLDNWDTSFPLVVGNEAVGKRQWSGKVHNLYFTAFCDSDEVSEAGYDFDGQAPYTNTFEDFSYPALDWSEGSSTQQDGQGVRLGPGEWLTTTEPFREFSEYARLCHSIWISTTVATIDPAQRGPARIISISADAEHRNVTLGQEKDALIIRLRTPASGENGQKPEILVPGVFTDGRMRRIEVRYIAAMVAPMLYVWVDGVEYSLSLAPGAAFFPGFVTENRWPVTLGGNPFRYDLAYLAIVVGLPAVVIGGLWAARGLSRRRGWR